MWGNQLQQLPDQFGNLTGLIRLGLKSNQLTQLPNSFCHLVNLVELFLTDNRLTTLPQGESARSGACWERHSFSIQPGEGFPIISCTS